MITFAGIRFACEKCQIGHRSSNCNHLSRCLLEIRGKGRPVSQCGFCRAKRKEKQNKSHHRCLCGDGGRPKKKIRGKVLYEIS